MQAISDFAIPSDWARCCLLYTSQLGLKKADPVFFMERIYFADGSPLCLTSTVSVSYTHLNNANVTVKRFVRFETGEGIEKKQEDFAAEVAAQMGN